MTKHPDREVGAGASGPLLAFAGSGLDRAAHLRGDGRAMAALRADQSARVLPVWRGKPLVAGAGERLGWLPVSQPGLDAAAEAAPLFLGSDAAGPRFACDLSAWQPAGGAEPAAGFHDPTEQVHPDFPDGMRFVELRGAMTRLDARDAELAATARALVAWHARHRFCANCGAASDMAEAGWRRDCAVCGARHFPRTDPVVIMAITRGDRMLMGRSPGWPDGMYSLLAGFVEPGETLEAAVRREVREEAGIRVGAVRYVVSQPWPFPASLMIACHGIAETEDITIDPAEIADAAWFDRQELTAIHAGRVAGRSAARPGAVARFVIERWLADRLGETPT